MEVGKGREKGDICIVSTIKMKKKEKDRKARDTHRHSGKTTWRHKEMTAIYKPGKMPQKKPTVLTPRSWISSYPVCGTFLWQP